MMARAWTRADTALAKLSIASVTGLLALAVIITAMWIADEAATLTGLPFEFCCFLLVVFASWRRLYLVALTRAADEFDRLNILTGEATS